MKYACACSPKPVNCPQGMTRLPIKTIHLNKSPVVISSLKTLTPEMASQWGIDMALQMKHAEKATELPDMNAMWAEIFKRPEVEKTIPDVDADLYGGFVGNNDRRRLNQLIALTPDKLFDARTGFEDERLEELYFRYKARNFPEVLNEDEQERWYEHCAGCLQDGQGGVRSLEVFYAQLNELSKTADAKGLAVLTALAEYGDSLA